MTEKARTLFLRETQSQADKLNQKLNHMIYIGLDTMLNQLFVDAKINFVHDKMIPRSERRYRPDYRSDKLHLIVEFNGLLPHYQNPDIIQVDAHRQEFYKHLGYDVIQIPYFIQLTQSAIKYIFSKYNDVLNREQMLNLVDSQICSFNINLRNTPAYLCPAGIDRMNHELSELKQYDYTQYIANFNYLKSNQTNICCGYQYLKIAD